MSRIWYDTEFIEDGSTIRLLSIGLVAEDDREYYAVADDYHALSAAVEHPWLREHVVPSLPVAARPHANGPWHYDEEHPDYPAVKHRGAIAREVRDFILAAPDPQMWAWYAAYDHVCLCQLWGRMIDLPKGVPMWTNDLKQEAERLGNPNLPPMPGVSEHNALSDAREVRFRHEWLESR